MPTKRKHLDSSKGLFGRYADYMHDSFEKANQTRTKHTNRSLSASEARARHANIANAYFNEAPTISNLYNGAVNWLKSKGVLAPEGTSIATGDVPTPGFAPKDLIRRASDTALALQVAADRYKNSKTLYSLANKAKHTDEEKTILDSAKELTSFLKGNPYRKRLVDYYNKIHPKSIYNENRAVDAVNKQLDNIGSAKINTYDDDYLWSSDGVEDGAAGVYSAKDHIISLLKRYLFRSTPKHEMIHASDKGKAFLDNKNYAMRVKPGIKDRGYYADIAEQRPRVLNTLIDMNKKGYNINGLTQEHVDSYFLDNPIDMLPTDAQSLFDNYEYMDILNALKNFKSALPYVGAGAVATGLYNRSNSRKTYRTGGTIHIKPENRGKFNALKKRTGKTTEELTHSKNPLTRKRAIFAQNARKWNHKKK